MSEMTEKWLKRVYLFVILQNTNYKRCVGMKYGFFDQIAEFNIHKINFFYIFVSTRSYGVMVSTQDSESCDPSSNLGRTYIF